MVSLDGLSVVVSDRDGWCVHPLTVGPIDPTGPNRYGPLSGGFDPLLVQQ